MVQLLSFQYVPSKLNSRQYDKSSSLRILHKYLNNVTYRQMSSTNMYRIIIKDHLLVVLRSSKIRSDLKT